jgi:hypothetical protein
MNEAKDFNDYETIVSVHRLRSKAADEQDKIYCVQLRLTIAQILKNIQDIRTDPELREKHKEKDSIPYQHGESFRTFEEAAEYAMMCELHGNMTEIINLTTGQKVWPK